MSAQQAASGGKQDAVVFPAEPKPFAFIRLNTDNTVTVVSKSMEAGQGIHTTHAILVAEEIDAAPAQIRIASAPAQAGVQAAYGNALMGGIQGTGGQTGTQSSYMMYRMAGAAMRQMILTVAAKRLGVQAGELSIRAGVVSHAASGRSLRFGDIAAHVMAQTPPTEVKPKEAKDFTYIGKHFPRVDDRDKIRGKTVYTQDIKLPGMLVAVVQRPSRLGAKVASVDASLARKLPGVLHVVQIPAGVAVVAGDFWTADTARNLLRITWDNSQAIRVNTREISQDLHAMLDEPGAQVLRVGDADAAMAGAAQRIVADYEVPYQSHTAMETMNGVMQVRSDGIEVWGGSQIFGFDSIFIAQAAGIPMEKIKVNMLQVGGTFGRLDGPDGSVWMELLHIIKALGTHKPVKLMMSREDDMSINSAYYRPGYVHRLEAGLDAQGKLIALRHRIAGQSMLIGNLMERDMVSKGIDYMSVESSVDLPYHVPNQYVDLHSPAIALKSSPTRFGGSLHNGFANESMVDEVARAVGADPLRYRLNLLPNGLRERGCLELVAQKSDWFQPLPAGAEGTRRGRGVAVTPSQHCYSACVAEVTVDADKRWRIDRLVVAIDCGLVINPDNLRGQIEGAAAFAVSLGRYSAVHVMDGVALERYFNEYRITRIHTMPKVEGYFVSSLQPPSGAGETIGSSVIPAIANALADATGLRLRKLPLRLPGEPPEADWERPARLNKFATPAHAPLEPQHADE
jgi:isoquinoline 1-oxidoreductase beta subunit